jgi:hypothetical protein
LIISLYGSIATAVQSHIPEPSSLINRERSASFVIRDDSRNLDFLFIERSEKTGLCVIILILLLFRLAYILNSISRRQTIEYLSVVIYIHKTVITELINVVHGEHPDEESSIWK